MHGGTATGHPREQQTEVHTLKIHMYEHVSIYEHVCTCIYMCTCKKTSRYQGKSFSKTLFQVRIDIQKYRNEVEIETSKKNICPTTER